MIPELATLPEELPLQPLVISIIITSTEELDELLLSTTEELDKDELVSCDELDGIGLPADWTELDEDEVTTLLEDVITTELELFLPPPPLLPPQAVSARLTAKTGITFCTRIGKTPLLL